MLSINVSRVIRHLLVTSLLVIASGTAIAQNDMSLVGAKIQRALTNARALDPYFQNEVYDVASNLVKAADGRWAGVQVNSPYRAGWLNIYLVDGNRLPQAEVLQNLGLQNLSAENLAGGGFADPATDIIFIGINAWKRWIAATKLTRLGSPRQLIHALATVDAMGMDSLRMHWDEQALAIDSQENKLTGWLMRGALAFVLAHEMGHLISGRHNELKDTLKGSGTRLRLDGRKTSPSNIKRLNDETSACLEFARPETKIERQAEFDADAVAASLIGQQCRVGRDGDFRHSIYLLGLDWYFLTTTSDKLLAMGRASNSEFIASALRSIIGAEIYGLVVASRASPEIGAVAEVYSKHHPPDIERLQLIQQRLSGSSCGAGDFTISSQGQQMELVRAQLCQRLVNEYAK